MKIAYYVSSHGFGHAKRSAAIMKSLLTIAPEARFFVRTLASPDTFGAIPRSCFGRPLADFVIAEKDALDINEEATARNLMGYLNRYEETLSAEEEFVKDVGIEGLISDVPFIAGDIARNQNLKCATIVNFTWDWIMEEILQDTPGGNHALMRMREAYRGMTLVLQTPFSHDMQETFQGKPVENVAFALCDCERANQLLAWNSLASRMHTLLVAPTHVVFYDIRTLPIKQNALSDLVRAFANTFFLIRGERTVNLCDNATMLGPEFSYDDILNACTVFVCKLGYCTVGRCIAGRKRLLFPTRVGFREEKLLRKVSDYVPAVEIARPALESGNWYSELCRLMELPFPTNELDTDGAGQCAKKIFHHFTPSTTNA